MPSLSPTLYLSVVLVLFHFGQTAPKGKGDTCKVDYRSESTPSLKMTKTDIRAVFSNMFQTDAKLDEYCKMQGVECSRKGFGGNYTSPTLQREAQTTDPTGPMKTVTASNTSASRLLPSRFVSLTNNTNIPRRGKRNINSQCCETSRTFVEYTMIDSWFVVHFPDEGMIQYVHVAECMTGTCQFDRTCIPDYSCHYLLVSATDPAPPGSLSVSIKPFWFPSCCKCF